MPFKFPFTLAWGISPAVIFTYSVALLGYVTELTQHVYKYIGISIIFTQHRSQIVATLQARLLNLCRRVNNILDI